MISPGGNGTRSDPQAPCELIPQKHGGALRRGGGNPKRTGGYPPSELRARMRGALASRIRIAQEIADSPKATNTDRLRALDFLGKYGMGTTVTETDTEGHDVHIHVTRAPRRILVDD